MGEKDKSRRLFRRVSAIGLALIFCLFAAGCKKTEDEAASPLSPPAWILGSWLDQGYFEKSVYGSGWVFTQDNAIHNDYMYGLPHLAPWDYFKFYLECLQGKHEYEYSLTDFSSDTYYEIHEILAAKGGNNPFEATQKFVKLTPTTFRFIISSKGRDNEDFGVFTKKIEAKERR
jgi:hypothetical protein